MLDIGPAVRRLRKRLGLSGAEVARQALGNKALSDQLTHYADQLSKLERGERGHQNPSLERLESIASGFKLSLAEFFSQLAFTDPPAAPSSVPEAVTDETRAALPSDAELTKRLLQEVGFQLYEANRKLAEATEELARSRQELAQAERDRAELPAPDRQPAARTYDRAAEHAPRRRGGHPRHVARKKTRRPRKR